MDEEEVSYIYVFSNKNEPYLKIGKADRVYKRKRNYKTYSSAAWLCESILQAPRSKIDLIDNWIKQAMSHYNHREDGGGTEFYDLNVEQVCMLNHMIISLYSECKIITDFNPVTGKILNHTNKPPPMKTVNHITKRLCVYRDLLGENSRVYKYIEDTWNDLPYGRYARAFQAAAKGEGIMFQSNLNLPNYTGEDHILRDRPLNMECLDSVNLYIKELNTLKKQYRGQFKTTKDNFITNVTFGNGNLLALLNSVKNNLLSNHF
tara:strand:+ start:86 stop:871 length:786 start_codon:yes stop_codon:yes gene_type:complete